MTADGETAVRTLVVRNTLTQMAVACLSLGLGVLSAMILSRYLGVDRFGKFNYLLAFFAIFLALNDFGINTVVVREASRDRRQAGQIIGSILSFKLLLAGLSILVSWAVVASLDFPGDVKRGFLAYSLILPLSALQLPSVIYQVELKVDRFAVLSLVGRLFGLLFILVVVWLRLGLTILMLSLILAEGAFLWVLLKDSRRWIRPALSWDLMRWGEILRSSLPLGLTSFLVMLINRVDFILLERLTDFRQVGFFSAAHKVTNLLEALPLMVMGTLYPLMAWYSQENPARLRSLYRKSAFLLAAVAVPMGLLFTAFSTPVVRLLFGRQFLPAAPALSILIWSTVLLYPAICGGNLLIALGKERVNLWINAVAAPLNLVLNLLWIPRFGFIGAAWATLATYALIFLATMVAAERAFGRFQK